MAQRWYNLTEQQTAARFSCDMTKGLDHRKAAARLRREGKNRIYSTGISGPWTLAAEVLRDPCAYMLVLAALLCRLFGEDVGAYMIIALTLFNAIVVTGAYIKSKTVIDTAEEHAIPTATVLRDGKQYIVKQTDVCRGDVILLTRGDMVPADARVIESEGLRVIETAVTGDRSIRKKDPKILYGNNIAPENQSNMVFAASVVSGGSGRAIVCDTGYHTLIHTLDRVKEKKKAKLGILDILKKYCTVWGLTMLMLIFVLTLANFIIGFESRGILDIFMTGLSLATAAMCEYYLVFGYIIIGSGLYGMMRNRKDESSGAIIKNIDSIETLANLTTLIVSKEGAFVTDRVSLKKLWCDSTAISPTDRHLDRMCQTLIESALDSTAYPLKDYQRVYNSVMAGRVHPQDRAVFELAASSGVFDGLGYIGTHILLDRTEDPTTGMTRTMMMEKGEKKIILKGSPDIILPLCNSYRSAENIKSIKNEKTRVKNAAARFAKQGISVICYASANTDANTIDSAYEEGNFIFEGFIAASEPHLKGARENVLRLKEAGIRTVMLCDDVDPGNVNYATELGIIESENQVMTPDMPRGTDGTFLIRTADCSLFEGLDTRHKRLLIEHYQSMGERVGYFGRDFDDISLLKAADIGYSSGVTLGSGNASIDLGSIEKPVYIKSNDSKKNGCEALKQLCDVVVSPADRPFGGYNAIADSIASSKRVYASLAGMMRYLITSQCARLFVFLYSVLMPAVGVTYFGGDVFAPVHLLFLGVIVDLCAVMAFAFRSSSGKLTNNIIDPIWEMPFKGNLRQMLFGVCFGALAVLLPVILRLTGAEVTGQQMSTAVFYGFLLTQQVCALETMTPRSVFRGGFDMTKFAAALTLSVIFIAACTFISPIASMFRTYTLSPLQWLIVAGLPLLMLAVYEIYKLISNRKNDDDLYDIQGENEYEESNDTQD